jgi:hypothetical protein
MGSETSEFAAQLLTPDASNEGLPICGTASLAICVRFEPHRSICSCCGECDFGRGPDGHSGFPRGQHRDNMNSSAHLPPDRLHRVTLTDMARRLTQRLRFRSSADYWERRYRNAGTSGAGSYGEQAEYKARFLNQFVADHNIDSVIELGSGDGNQLSLAAYPSYLGLDVSSTAIEHCISRHAGDTTKSFLSYSPTLFHDPAGFIRAELALSLDVIYHLIEDATFDQYMSHLFAAATRYVAIYATDEDGPRTAAHVRHRRFSNWISRNRPDWQLALKQGRPKPEYQDFFIYEAAQQP